MDKAEKLCAWIEDNLGGKVTSCTSQERWRDAWFVTLSRDGEDIPLYVRGDRNEEFPPQPLEYEAAVMDVLGKNGVPVPQIYGVCPDPHAIVMARSGGRHNLKTAESDEERLSVLEQLGEIYGDMHKLDVAQFAQVGALRPGNASEAALLSYILPCEEVYRRHKTHPEPRIEFLLSWLRRNIPAQPDRLSILQQDAGQFMFEKGRVTALVDWELACISDPMLEIAALRQRALAEPMGDLRPLLRKYVETSGLTLDRQRIAFHSAAWLAGSSTLMVASLDKPKAETNFPEYLSWYVGCMTSALQAIAEHDGYDLEGADILPTSAPSRWSAALRQLRERLDTPVDGQPLYDQVVNRNTATFARNIDGFGAWTEADYIADVAKLTGQTPAGWADADAILEAFVARAGKEHDRTIVEIIYRWLKRQAVLIEGLYAHPFGRMMPLDELLAL
jgi:aminoglycoside phosphotransferase (APT) family kinase protein